MKPIALPLVLLLLFGFVSPMAAQSTHTFAFGAFSTTYPGCSEFTQIDGQPPNEGDGDSGMVCFPFGENPWWGLEAPSGPNGGWNFPNNGFLTNNTPTPSSLNASVFSVAGCNLKTAGCVDYEMGTAQFTGYGQGVTVSVTVWFVVNKHTHYGRGCYLCTYYTNDETNGTGTASY